jgi:diguanylate cyclase
VSKTVARSRRSTSSWWLTRQPASIRIYFAATLAVAVLLTLSAESLSPTSTSFNFVGVGTFCALAVGVSMGTRPVLTAFPGSPAIEDLSGAWMLAALLLWGPTEALVIAVVIGGVWTQFFDQRFAGSHRRTAQQVLNVAGMVIGLDLAYLVIHWIGHQPHMIAQVGGMLAYIIGNSLVILGIVGLSGDGHPLSVIDSWSSRVMMLTEAPLGVGIYAAWRTDPVAGALLAGTLIAAAAGLHAAHMLEEASTDRRTGLLRPDAWTGTVARLVSRQKVALILADVDHFKQVNDRYGHLVGDEVLSAIGNLITESLRPGDVAGRWGGEEFVVALPGVDGRAAREIAERLADTVRSAPGVVGGPEIRCTISVGVALVEIALPGEADAAVQEALRNADMAMYAAKRSGRDRVFVVDDLSPAELDPSALMSGGTMGGGTASSDVDADASAGSDDAVP